MFHMEVLISILAVSQTVLERVAYWRRQLWGCFIAA